MCSQEARTLYCLQQSINVLFLIIPRKRKMVKGICGQKNLKAKSTRSKNPLLHPADEHQRSIFHHPTEKRDQNTWSEEL
jgi:hypothetical protein